MKARDSSLDDVGIAVNSHSDAADDESVTRSTRAHIPDGGWGWVVVCASLLFNIIYDGCSYSFGIIYINLLDYFGDTKSNTAWIGSLFFAVPLLCGPIAARISKTFGYRKSTMVGGLIASFGFLIGSFSNSIWMLAMFYGLVSGFGMSIPYFNSTVVVANYFEKRRALATGISECGAGLGTLIFAPLVHLLVENFGWRGALLILSGVVSNTIVCGALYRPLKHNEKVDDNATESYHLREKNVKKAEDVKKHISVSINGAAESKICDRESVVKDSSNEDSIVVNCTELDTFILGDPSLISEDTNPSTGIQIRNQKRCTHKSRHRAYCLRIGSHLKPFMNIPFIIFIFSNFVMYFWYDVPYVFLVDHTHTIDISATRGAFLLSIIGIVHTVGILLYGYLGDIKSINSSLLFGVSIALCGVSVFLVPLFQQYQVLATLAGGFGLFSAATEALVPIILIELVGLERFDEMFSIVMFLEGVANLAGPPVAGFICDYTGQYNSTFYAAGVSISFTGCLFAVIPVLQRNIKRGSS